MKEQTKLKLLRDWDTPTHFLPKGLRGSALYFANMCGVSLESFIKTYNEAKFIEWFEIIKSE